MLSQRRWIILLFPILGSCKKPTSLNRKIGCTDKTLCWDDHHHLCIPCDIRNNHQDNHHDDHHDDKVDDLHYDDKLEPPFSLGKKPNDQYEHPCDSDEHQNIDCFQNIQDGHNHTKDENSTKIKDPRCSKKFMCWNWHHHLCLPCLNDHKDNHQDDHQDNKHDKQHFNDQYQPIIGSGKKSNWPPKIGGRDSLPSARRSLKNRVFPYPTNKDWTEDKTVAQNRKMSADKLTKINRQKSAGDECEAKQGWCYLYLTGKCIACKEYVLEFAIALDKGMAANSGKQQILVCK